MIHTRKKILRDLDTDERIMIESSYVEKFSLYSKKCKDGIHYFPTILLKAITIVDDENRKTTIDHSWIKADEFLIENDIAIGMTISFSARLGKYKKTKYHIDDYGIYDVNDLSIISKDNDTQTVRDFLKEATIEQNKSLAIKYQYLLKEK